MELNGTKIDFPAVSKTSFSLVIENLKIQAQDEDEAVAAYAQNLLDEVEKHPELKEGIEEDQPLDKYKSTIDKLCRTLFPDALSKNEIKAAMPPFTFKPFYLSSRFKGILDGNEEAFLYNFKSIDPDIYYLYACLSILGAYYKYPTKVGPPMIMETVDNERGTKRSFRMAYNADLMEFIPTNRAVDITREDYELLMDNIDDIALWKKKFPKDSWIMRGVGIINMMDVTVDQSLSGITSNLLFKSKNSFENIRKEVKNLFNNTEIEVGIVTFEEGELVPIPKSNVSSILLGDNVTLDCNEAMCQFTFKQLINNKEPLIIPDVNRYHGRSKSSISEQLVKQGFKSYIIAPLVYEEELLGFLELASRQTYELNAASMSVMDKVVPVLAMAAKRFKTETQNQIEAIIQQECTTIHESVKWRFETEAHKFLMNKMNNEEAVFNDIIFKDVYPLYGQLDIKSSSSKRNEAVKADLLRQMEEVRKILVQASSETGIIAYEELIFRVDNYSRELKKGISAGSEHKMLEFFRSSIYPVFNHLKENSTKSKVLIDKYESLLDIELHTIYNERKKYDQSVNFINHRLAGYLDERQAEAQRMFPHYFERYKTDGVEYNMYIGQSISKSANFDPVHLQNLRLWQLIVMCQMEREFKLIQKDLAVEIEIASLILVYSTSLAVHFRMDEKRFDVEGAYNARYEIIKKRVDKAHIKGTKERITQPGQLAIIYSQEQDARDYKRYLQFLHSRGYVEKDFEDLELEDLQGITGLRALRAKVDYSSGEDQGEGYTVDELMESIQSTSN